jgi:hypothetical protein
MDRLGLELLEKADGRIEAWKAIPQGAFLKANVTYDGLGSHTREVFYLKPRCFLINDYAYCGEGALPTNYRLLFHIDPSKKVTRTGESYLIQSSRGTAWMALIPVIEGYESGIIKGQKSPRVQGWVSYDGSHLEEAPVVFFEANGGSSARFSTLIYLGEGETPDQEASSKKLKETLQKLEILEISN